MSRRELTIERLGARGEGVARLDGRLVFVPYALAGERIVADVAGDTARLVEVLEPSPDRIAPICPHYGVCGGCAVQTLRSGAYLEWKRGLVETALRNAGLEARVAPVVEAHGAGRRRVRFHARGAHVGFMRARAHEIVEIDACPLLAPGLAPALDAARALAAALARKEKPLDIAVVATLDGLDVDLRGSGALTEPEAKALVDLALRCGLARLSNHGRIVAQRRKPRIAVGETMLTPPPGGFLQATAAGEEAIARLVLERIGDAKRVADLFCGAGAFALRLARRARVSAYDSDAAAVSALLEAAGAALGLKLVGAQTRDLFKSPLMPDELKAFDAAVFDPPRAGAPAQAEALAKSAIGAIVAVSCNPQSFARDARILTDAGWRLGEVTPIDQFLFSPHVELVAAFSREARAAKKRSILSR